jgi:sialic acid synthase SpsE
MNLNNLKKTFIIAEIGNNHEGSFNVACKLIKEAKKAGVDAVKFQTYRTEDFIHIKEIKRFRKLKKFELTKEEFYKLSCLAKNNNLKFISTPFDINSAVFLNKIVDCFKVASGDNNYYQLIETILKFNKTTLISTGLLNFKEVLNLYKFIKNEKFNTSKLAFLHCVSSYPVPNYEANLLSIKFLKKKIPLEIGYSDHTIGVNASLAAFVLGSKIIEKHFTLDNNYSKFRDHKISLDPAHMKYLVDSIRSIEKMMGKENKIVQPSEKKNFFSMRRSIYSSSKIKKNSKIFKNTLSILRPRGSLNPVDLNKIIGKTAKINIDSHKIISLKDFKN